MHSTRPTGTVSYNNSGRIAVVTGGASGIGRAVCEAFLESQAAGVVCLDINVEAAGALPDGVDFIRCDTANIADCQSAVAEVLDRFGSLDILVNNASIQPPESYRPIHQLPLDVWNRLVSINLTGYTQMAQAALVPMLRQRSGVIVNLASGQGHRTARLVGTYGPLKAANIMQARQWGIEYAREGIRVVSVSPGAIETPLVKASLEQQGGREALENRHPVGRIGQPHEVAQAVLWLCSGDATFVTATDLEVDGGLGAFAAFAEPYEPPVSDQ